MNRPLATLRPEWLNTGGLRYQMGVEFDCPAHPPQGDADHRLRFWFDNPCDGDPPAPSELVDLELYPHLVHRLAGYDFMDSLTLVPVRNSDMPLLVNGHWCGYVVEGIVYDALSWGW